MDGNDKHNTNPSNSNITETMESETNLIEGYSKIEDFTKDGYKALIEATKNSNSLPQERDWDFYNTHESFKNLMTSEGNEILQLINNILKQQSVYGNIKNRDLDEKIELVIEANDIILERVANNLDELAGIRKNPQLPVEIQTVSAELPISGSWNRINSAKIIVETAPQPTQSIIQSPNSIRLLTGKNIQRPQKYFKDRIDNSKSPWEPRIKDKPNNLKPLAIYLEYTTDDGAEEIFCHPYEFELERFEPSEKQLTKIIPSVPRTLDDTPLHLIEQVEQLEPMLQDLRKYNEISVDLEHHSYRSYMGITCLMQISTGETDYLIDTLKLRDKLHILNEVFTKPSVVKVFHGADMDILWLQRDLSIYVVNMFDTHQAAKQLEYPHLSLAYLLRRFCQIDADKHFQLADWRIRPLPDELKTYAREDTHYLLYIYHMMRNELLTQGENVLKAVITSSTQICKKRYEKPIIREDSHMELYRKCKKLFDNRQMFALKHLYEWRDDLAREEDESIGFVLPNHMMLQIAELLPREMQGILACCNPIPPLVRANLLELHKIILKAREQSIIKPILSEDTRNRGSTQLTTKINIDNVLNCPHDLLKTEEFRDDLPTLLGSIIQENSDKIVVGGDVTQTKKIKPKICIFETPDNSDDDDAGVNINYRKNSKMNKLKFLGPYERYKLVKTYMQAEEKKQEQKPSQSQQQPNQDQEQNKNKIDNENTSTNDKSNAERLAALQQHFKTMAAATNQLQPPENLPDHEKNAVTLGRQSEKRKRCDYDDDEDNEYAESKHETSNVQQKPKKPTKPHQNQQQQQQQNQKKKKQRGKKKPNNNKPNEGESLAQQKKTEKRNKNKNKRNIQTRGQQQQQQKQQQQQQQQQHPNTQHYISRKRKQNESNSNNQQQQQQQNNKRARRSENFQPFDYSAVNFQQFQGGAGSAHQPKNVGSNFKSRGSKNKKTQNIGRSNTKSATFGGNNNNRGSGGRGGGGRGAGRGGGGRGGRGNGRYY